MEQGTSGPSTEWGVQALAQGMGWKIFAQRGGGGKIRQPLPSRHTRVGEIRMTFLSLVPGKGGPQALQGSLALAPHSWANCATNCHWPWRSCQTLTAPTGPWAPKRAGQGAGHPSLEVSASTDRGGGWPGVLTPPEAACQIRTPRGASSWGCLCSWEPRPASPRTEWGRGEARCLLGPPSRASRLPADGAWVRQATLPGGGSLACEMGPRVSSVWHV